MHTSLLNLSSKLTNSLMSGVYKEHLLGLWQAILDLYLTTSPRKRPSCSTWRSRGDFHFLQPTAAVAVAAVVLLILANRTACQCIINPSTLHLATLQEHNFCEATSMVFTHRSVQIVFLDHTPTIDLFLWTT
jgi:hypothetical protein